MNIRDRIDRFEKETKFEKFGNRKSQTQKKRNGKDGKAKPIHRRLSDEYDN